MFQRSSRMSHSRHRHHDELLPPDWGLPQYTGFPPDSPGLARRPASCQQPSFFAVGGTLSPWLAGYMYDITGSYTGTYVLLVVALLATAAMMWFVAPRKLNPIGH